MKNIRLYLFRHGITQGNIERRYLGSATDESLCEEGRAQLCQLYSEYHYPAPATVFAGPLKRCIESAEILFPQSGNKIIIEQLTECAFGEFENKSFEELKTNPDFANWLNPAAKFTPNGAESAEIFHLRCADTLMKLLEYMFKTKTEEAAVVTHGGVIMSMLAQCALPKKPAEEWLADPGCGYLIQCSAAMFMRDRAVEAVSVVPFGYLDEDNSEEEDDYDYESDIKEEL